MVNQFVFSDPRHHGTQLRADFFDLVVGSQAAAGSHAGVVDGTFLDEHFGVFAGLDAFEGIAHGFAGFVVNDFHTGNVFAVLRVVGME